MSKRTRAQLALAAALTSVGLMTAPSGAQAAGAGYNLLHCHDYFRATPDLVLDGGGEYVAQNKCAQGDARLELTNAQAAVRNQGRQFVIGAPPGTVITEIHVDANLRSGDGHRAEIAYFNGSSVIPLAGGPASDPSWQRYDFGGFFATQMVLRLYCSNGNCPGRAEPHLYARNIVLRVADGVDPSVPEVAGSLLGEGWLRGSQSLSATASDVGAGIGALSATVNGVGVATGGSCDTGGLGFPNTGRIAPCASTAALTQQLNTAAAPFANGSNTIRVAASDFPGNGGGVVERTVLIDNAAPALVFANSQEPNSVETIRASVSDAHSGVAGAEISMRSVGASGWQSLETRIAEGEARAHVDSGSFPAGEYEFRATAGDVAGNASETTRRANGDPMRLTFPLRQPVELRAHLNRGGSRSQVVRYGTQAKAKGLLLDEAGEPIADQRVTIVENFGAGALLRERVSQATTNEKGKWRSKIPAGPSRDVRVIYGGTGKFAPAGKGVGTFLVRSRASLRTSRKSIPAGKTVRFEGKVRHFGARIPSGGKLLELQVRIKTGRWQTVGESFRTNRKGVYRRSYRFGRHYSQDALFRFRLKVKREVNWPYKRTNTGQRKVIVRAR